MIIDRVSHPTYGSKSISTSARRSVGKVSSGKASVFVDPAAVHPHQVAAFVAAILRWYDDHRRVLPWRAPPGERADPYHVWLSEIMLQQTTVATVQGYFARFLARWPTVGALAAAPLDDVLHAWQGLGYYARARNLHKCAKLVVAQHDSAFPPSFSDLRALPGIGDYTAAAISAIAFDRPANVVDGNIERVTSRLFAIEAPLPTSKPQLKAAAALLAPQVRPGDYAQALMDLGATICTPRAPECGLCPVRDYCRANRLAIATELPRKLARKDKPVRVGWIYWLQDDAGRVFLRRRPERGLLGGMMEFPSTDWVEADSIESDSDQLLAEPDPMSFCQTADWQPISGDVRHSFTHFHLRLSVWLGTVASGNDFGGDGPDAGLWHPIDSLADLALPTLMKKVASHVLAQKVSG